MSMTRERRRSWLLGPTNADCQVELVEFNFKRLLRTVVAGCLGVIGCTTLMAVYYKDPWLWRIAEITLVVSAVRVSVILAFNMRRRPELTPQTAGQWEIAYFFATLLYCLCVASCTLYDFRYHDANACNLNTIAVFILCSALCARIGMRPRFVQICCAVLLASLAISLLCSPASFAKLTGALIFVFAHVYFRSVTDAHAIVLEQLRTRRRLRELTEEDALTRLASRRHFENCLAAACRQEQSFCVLFIDLDKFKQVNDTYGHRIGDYLLRAVAERIRLALRQGDLAARLGGDEFAILQTGLLLETSAEALAQRLNQALAEPFVVEGQTIRIGASIGIRLAKPGEKDPERMLSLADQALYQVKQAGGGSYALAHA
jgi:diguanylate cyclase (GGDEF)-like protein